jgi:hypothetical protein
MGVTWAQLEAAAPEIGARGRAVIERRRLLLLGTLRADGSPRISAVEAHIVDGDLALALIPRSHKARDLARDARLVLQSPVADAGDPGQELKLSGGAVEVAEPERRAGVAGAVAAASGWRPGDAWTLVTVDIEAAAHIEWIAGEMVLHRWSAARGELPVERRRLDVDAGAYLSTDPAGADRAPDDFPPGIGRLED